MVKLLLLQQWYGLCDPGLEEAEDDRLSFRRFAGLPMDEDAPDHSAIWRFRQELARHGLSEALFGEINRQLDARGMIVRQGTLIDATIVKAAVKPPPGKDGLMRRAARNKPLKNWRSWFNKAVPPIRAGLARDACTMRVMCAAINLRRALVLAA